MHHPPVPRASIHVSRDTDADAVITRLRDIWLEATPDSIRGDIERAKVLARAAPATERERAIRYLEAIRRLERWLHDM
jgi:hypothetical protein